jgi:hypothetical protein
MELEKSSSSLLYHPSWSLVFVRVLQKNRCTRIYKRRLTMETGTPMVREKTHDLPSANRRSRKASGDQSSVQVQRHEN